MLHSHILSISPYSVGCGDTKNALAAPMYEALEKVLLAKNKAERDLKTYTNLVRCRSVYYDFYIYILCVCV